MCVCKTRFDNSTINSKVPHATTVQLTDREGGAGGTQEKKECITHGKTTPSLKDVQDVRCVMNISVKSDWLRF